MFDTHQRFRWRAMGQPHDLTQYNQLESQSDARAASTPLNIYLHDRLTHWREAVQSEVYVFENLMLQGSISCPQPYTPQLLADLKSYKKIGVEGVIYEAFEPGMASFSQQLGVLAKAMWTDEKTYPATPLEQACYDLTENDSLDYHFKNCFNVLSYLTTTRFDGPSLLREQFDDPPLSEYVDRLECFLRERTHVNFCHVLKHIMEHQDRFDWMFITLNLAWAIEPAILDSVQDAQTRQVLTADKICDMLEATPDPVSLMTHVVNCLLASE